MTTHSAECYKWHRGCAVLEVERLRALLDPDNEALVEQIADVAFEKWDTARLGRFTEVARAVLAALRKEADQ